MPRAGETLPMLNEQPLVYVKRLRYESTSPWMGVFRGTSRVTGHGRVERKPDTTKITGTATSDYGTYDVNVTQ